MSCTDCPELIPNPNEGCLKPINTDCVTYNGEDIVCAEIVAGQNLNQIIEQLANNDCDLQEQIEDIVQDIEELSGNVINIQNNLEELSGSVQTQINNIPSFTCEDLSGCSIDDLLDVDVSPISGDNLIFNGIKWINQTPQIIDSFNCSDLSGCTLDSIGNVIEISSNSGDVLINNGTNWVNQSFASLFTANNGLTKTGSNIKLGGILTENTIIDGDSNKLVFKNQNLYARGNVNIDPLNTIFNEIKDFTRYEVNNLGTGSQGTIIVEQEVEHTIGNYNIPPGRGVNAFRSFCDYKLSANTTSVGGLISNNANVLRILGTDNTYIVNVEDFVNTRSFIDFKSNLLTRNTITNITNVLIDTFVSSGDVSNNATNFIQLKIKPIAEGSNQMQFATITNKYAILQEGTNDINRFFGEIRYSNGLTNVSDKRTKTEKSEFKDGLESLLQIRPIIFNRIEKYGNVNKDHVGIIAQELEEVLPIAVDTRKVEEIEDFKTFTPETLIYVCINAIKELKQEIDDNKKKYDEKFVQLSSMIETQQQTIELLSQKNN